MLLADGTASAGPLGLLVLVLLGVATVLLVRSMNARLKRLPPSFDPEPEATPSDTDETPPPS